MEAGAWIAAAVGLAVWLVVLAAALCALLGMLLASAGGMRLWAGALTGMLGGAFGVAVLAVVALVRRSGAGSEGPGSKAPAADAPGSAPHAELQSEPAPAVAAARAPRPFRLRRVEIILLGVVALALAATLFLDSVRVSVAGLTVFALPILGTGLDLLAGITLLPCAGVAALLGWGAPRWAAALAATVAASWLALLGVVAALWLPVRSALEQATTAGGTVGDALGRLGLRVDGAGIALPESGVFTMLGLSGRRFELASIDLGAVVPHLSLGLGAGILTLALAALGFAVLAVLAVFALGVPLPPGV